MTGLPGLPHVGSTPSVRASTGAHPRRGATTERDTDITPTTPAASRLPPLSSEAAARTGPERESLIGAAENEGGDAGAWTAGKAASTRSR